MNLITLRHLPHLRYLRRVTLFNPTAISIAEPDHMTVVTFARGGLDARDRLQDEPAGDDRVFRKRVALQAEAQRGLDVWNFCIPIGDGAPAALNACVPRFLSLGVPQTEIIHCGLRRFRLLQLAGWRRG